MQRSKDSCSSRGFTLAEVIIALAILSVVFAIASKFMFGKRGVYKGIEEGEARMKVYADVGRILFILKRDFMSVSGEPKFDDKEQILELPIGLSEKVVYQFGDKVKREVVGGKVSYFPVKLSISDFKVKKEGLAFQIVKPGGRRAPYKGAFMYRIYATFSVDVKGKNVKVPFVSTPYTLNTMVTDCFNTGGNGS